MPPLNGSGRQTVSWVRFAVACLDQVQMGVGNALESGRKGGGRLEVGKGWVCPPFTRVVIYFLEPRFTSCVNAHLPFSESQ